MKKYLTNNDSETIKLGEEFAVKLTSGDVVMLSGNLGAGKTTFVQGIAKGLGIKDRILSPTFVLVRSHRVDSEKFQTLNHIDLYRIEGQENLEKLGITEFITSENSVTIIEWAEKITDFIPVKGYRINFVYLGENKREINIEDL